MQVITSEQKKTCDFGKVTLHATLGPRLESLTKTSTPLPPLTMANLEEDPLARTHGPCGMPYLDTPHLLTVKLPAGSDAPLLKRALQKVQFQLRGMFGPNIAFEIIEPDTDDPTNE